MKSKAGNPLPPMWKVPLKWVDRFRFIDELPKGGRVAQLGVWRGQFSKEILKRMSPENLIMVDAWEDYGLPDELRCKPRWTKKQWDDLFAQVCKEFAGIPEAIIERQSFHGAASLHSDESFGFIYHDGDVPFDHVLGTLEEWWPKLKVGGYWMGCDYAVTTGSGVIEAVTAFLRQRQNLNVGFLGITRGDNPPAYVLRK